MTGHRIRTVSLLTAGSLAAAVLAAPAPVVASKEQGVTKAPSKYIVRSFTTPSGNIRCVAVKEGKRWSLRCDTLKHKWRPPARDCGEFGDNTGSVAMTKRKRPRFICVSDAIDRGRVLKYGRVWDKGPFTCKSRRKGLRCYNLAGHGWFLSRRSYRLF